MNSLTSEQRWARVKASLDKLKQVDEATIKDIVPLVINFNKYVYTEAYANKNISLEKVRADLSAKQYAKIRLMELRAEKKKLEEILIEEVI